MGELYQNDIQRQVPRWVPDVYCDNCMTEMGADLQRICRAFIHAGCMYGHNTSHTSHLLVLKTPRFHMEFRLSTIVNIAEHVGGKAVGWWATSYGILALMKVNNELDALSHCKIEPMQFEFLPRIAGGIASVLGLTVLGGVLTLILAYLSIYGFDTLGLAAFTTTIASVFSLTLLLGLAVKCVFFGLAVTALPIIAGLETPKKTFMIPVSVLRGMMRVFLALVLIEVLSLALKYI